MRRPAQLLFLCTGNSCRSQMAEGWARWLGGEAVRVRSAGIEAHGLNPRALAAMAEAGVDITSQTSERYDDRDLHWADVVVTVCGDARDQCPMLPPGAGARHWPLPDPARATGSVEDITNTFRAVRDELHERVAALLEELRDGRLISQETSQ